MRLQVIIFLLCLLSLARIDQLLCDRLSSISERSKWTCICSAERGTQGFIVYPNCSSSCSCSQKGSSADRWICVCAADALPKVNAVNNDTGCFSTCSCNSGSLSEIQSSNKQIPRKVTVIILLICLAVTLLALVTSVICYAYRRDKCPIQRPLFFLDKESSINSSTNLISQATYSGVVYSQYVTSSIDPGAGCIPKTLFVLRKRTGVIQGTISLFSYSELESATNSFSDTNLIGVGGSSHVYSGRLEDGRTVAIKRIKTKRGGPDAESAFLTEIKLISRLHHFHLVPLLGYCSEHQGKHAERLLVFDYMPNGNLRDCLDGASGKYLDWGTRIMIALGAAKGLEYLHEAAAPRILHRDVKSTNILLDEKWRPKITDLGMAKHLLNEGVPSCSSSPARMHGTFGYFAPEYAIVGRASLKSDVFSFGVVLLELITGRQPIYKSDNRAEESLVIWATPLLQDSKRVISVLPDPLLEGNFQEEEMQVMAYLAKECLLMDPDSRPTMSEVVQVLSTIAPEKSRRKKMPLTYYQRSPSGEVVSKRFERTYEGQHPDLVVEVEEIKQITTGEQSIEYVDHCLTFEKREKEMDVSSATCMQKIILTSDANMWHSQDDVTVDLMEPRFESFCSKL